MTTALRPIAGLFIALCVWLTMATHTWPGWTLLYVASLAIAAYALGDILCKVAEGTELVDWGAPARLAMGTPLLGAGLYVLTLVLPWAIELNWWLMFGTVVTVWLVLLRRQQGPTSSTIDGPVSRWLVPAVLIIVTLWCRDLLRPIELKEDIAVLRVWGDVYYHLSQIASLAAAHGPGTLMDVQMAGAAAHPYHFASYALPALLHHGAGLAVWPAFAGLLVPLGLALTSFAAFALVRPHFGEYAAAVAALGLLLLPDAAQWGAGVRFLGYHWLQQVGPAGLYGVSCAALALAWLNQACSQGRWTWLLLAYAYLLCTLMFKAQIFVATAFPVLIWPALFYLGISRPRRMAMLTLMTAAFGAAMLVSQHLPGVPVLKLDGSGLWAYSQKILEMQSGGLIKKSTVAGYALAGTHWWLRAGIFGLVLFWSTLSLYGLVGIRIFSALSQRPHLPVLIWTPWLILTCYLIMSLGLAMDVHQVGMPEELLHRPFVWAYFVWVVWMLGGAYWLRFGESLPPAGKARTWLLCAALLGLVVTPGYFGHGIQTMKSWDRGYQRPERCMVDVAWYIRDRSQADATFQDLGKDPDFAWSGLSERRIYALDSGGIRMPNGLSERLMQLDRFRNTNDVTLASASYQHAHIRYVISRPGFRANWESSGATKPVFTCGEYRVYEF
jgi:hypothetical protein